MKEGRSVDLQTRFNHHWHQIFTACGPRGLVAVSTGLDSMVLLTLLQGLPDHERPALSVLHVNHHLRAQSRQEQAFIEQWGQAHHIPVQVKDWQVSDHPATGIEAAARSFRYRWFGQQLMQGAFDWVATAHQADDQAETVLMKWVRGGDISQLTGIQAVQPFEAGQLIRPLLPFSKADLEAFARAHDLQWYEDASNQDLTVSRNRYRHQVLPQLKAENPQVLAHVADYAQQLSALLATAQLAIAPALAAVSPEDHLDIGAWQGLSPELQLPVLKAFIKREAPTLSTASLRMRGLMHWLKNNDKPTGDLRLEFGWRFVKRYDQLRLQQGENPGKKSQATREFMVTLNQWRQVTPTMVVGVFDSAHVPSVADDQQRVTLTPAELPLIVRPWRPTDVLAVGSDQHQSVRRALLNAKVPRLQRPDVLVVVTATGRVLQLVGIKHAYQPRSLSASPNDHLIVMVQQPKGEKHE